MGLQDKRRPLQACWRIEKKNKKGELKMDQYYSGVLVVFIITFFVCGFLFSVLTDNYVNQIKQELGSAICKEKYHNSSYKFYSNQVLQCEDNADNYNGISVKNNLRVMKDWYQ